MLYQVYYHLPSLDKFISSTEAENQSDLSGLDDLLHMLKSREDCVYVYLPEQKNRLEFYLEDEETIIFELQDSGDAGIFSKTFSRDQVDELVGFVPHVLSDPDRLGLNFECW